MPSVFFETFGCQMNVADSDLLAHALAARGYYRAETGATADLVVINTCSVRERAEIRAKARIAEYARHKKKNKHNQQLWVVGCMAQRLGKALITEIPGVDRVVGAKDIMTFVSDIDAVLNVSPPARTADAEAAQVSVFVPIMRGCNNFCSYCVVPYVRGEEQSIPAAKVENTVRELIDKGVKEITLLGQNVNSYSDGVCDFAELLGKMHCLAGLERIRFTTSHPKDCTLKLVRTMAGLPKVCNHIHLPVQSGSSRILGLMNRNYTREAYLERIEVIKQEVPGVDITTDAMVGFPSETEDDFQETLSLFESVRFTTAFMFAYSKRDGTAAAGMIDDVAVNKKKERLAALINVQTKITKEHYASMVGKELDVLFTERQRGRENLWMGQDNGCKRVLLACDDAIAGTILHVRVNRSSGMTLICERI
jgi:tRNA-2-methylthio-N6-dimethylallyladenosine synthase